jgi:hypothetical protein
MTPEEIQQRLAEMIPVSGLHKKEIQGPLESAEDFRKHALEVRTLNKYVSDMNEWRAVMALAQAAADKGLLWFAALTTVVEYAPTKERLAREGFVVRPATADDRIVERPMVSYSIVSFEDER